MRNQIASIGINQSEETYLLAPKSLYKGEPLSNASCNALTHDALTYMAVTVTHSKRGIGQYANGVGGEALVLRGSPFICVAPPLRLSRPVFGN